MSRQHPPSPVPADRDLWLGEPPFTRWGQHPHGILDLRVFDQDIWWVDITQQPHRIEEMSDAYVANVIGFLHRYRDYYYLATPCAASSSRWSAMPCSDDRTPTCWPKRPVHRHCATSHRRAGWRAHP